MKHRFAFLILVGWILFASHARGEDTEPQTDAAKAETWENALTNDPDNLVLRLRLIRHYYEQYADPAARARRVPHVLWLIENQPDHPEAGAVRSRLHPALNGNDYQKGAALWRHHTENHPDKAAVLVHAARFLSADDRARTISLLAQARMLEPDNPERADELSLHRRLAGDALRASHPDKALRLYRQALDDLESAVNLTDEAEIRFPLMTRLPELAFAAEKFDLSGEHARKLLAMAESFPVHWNHGNAVHAAHTVLGRIELANDNHFAGARHLLLSARIKGSPQLSSFGPSFDLAKAVLASGEKDAVIGYPHLCGSFWDLGRKDLERWIDEIRKTGDTSFRKDFPATP